MSTCTLTARHDSVIILQTNCCQKNQQTLKGFKSLCGCNPCERFPTNFQRHAKPDLEALKKSHFWFWLWHSERLVPDVVLSENARSLPTTTRPNLVVQKTNKRSKGSIARAAATPVSVFQPKFSASAKTQSGRIEMKKSHLWFWLWHSERLTLGVILSENVRLLPSTTLPNLAAQKSNKRSQGSIARAAAIPVSVFQPNFQHRDILSTFQSEASKIGQ